MTIALGSAPEAKGLPATSARVPFEPILNTDTVFALPLAVRTNCPLGSIVIATGWALIGNGLPGTGVRFKVDESIAYPLTWPDVLDTYRNRFRGSIAMADGFGPSWKGLPATGVGVPVVLSIVRISRVPGVEFVTARSVALVALLLLVLLEEAVPLEVLELLLDELLPIEEEELLLLIGEEELLLLSPPPQPQAAPQKAAHKSVRTFDRARPMRLRLAVIRPSTVTLVEKIKRCNVRTARASSIRCVDLLPSLILSDPFNAF
jgi:hypothetical protein